MIKKRIIAILAIFMVFNIFPQTEYAASKTVGNIDVSLIRLANNVCTTKKNPLLIALKGLSNSIDTSELSIDYEIPILGVNYKFGKNSTKYLFDRSDNSYYVYFEVPQLCNKPNEGFDFNHSYKDKVTIKIPSIGIAKNIEGEVSYISDYTYNGIIKNYQDGIKEISDKGFENAITTVSIKMLDDSINISSQIVDQTIDQEKSMKKLYERINTMSDQAFERSLKNIQTEKQQMLTKEDFIDQYNSYINDLVHNRTEAIEVTEKLSQTKSTINMLKNSKQVLEFIDKSLVVGSTILDIFSLYNGTQSILDNENIMAKKYVGFLNVITAEENILATSLAISAKQQAIRTLALKLASFTFAAGIAVTFADMSIDVRTKAVEEIDFYILDAGLCEKEYEDRKLELFLIGRNDCIGKKVNNLSYQEKEKDAELYNNLIDKYTTLINKMDEGYVRYTYSENWLGWLDWIGIRTPLNSTAADTYKTMYTQSLNQLKKDGIKYLETFYSEGYKNDTRYLQFIYPNRGSSIDKGTTYTINITTKKIDSGWFITHKLSNIQKFLGWEIVLFKKVSIPRYLILLKNFMMLSILMMLKNNMNLINNILGIIMLNIK